MSRRTRDVSSVASSYGSMDLRQALGEFLPRSGLGLVAGDGNLRWVPRMLVVAAILTTWGVAEAITDRFDAAREVVRSMWPTRRQPGVSYGGFMKALAHTTPKLLGILLPVLRRHVRRLAEKGGPSACWRIGRWAVFGVDGSRIECPMTAANEKAFGTAGKNRTGPQQFLTTMFHVATGLIWDYRRGTARSSERSHLLQMLDTLPPGAMLLADAGFTGYDVFRTITGGGRSLLIRVGSNVSLLTKLGWACERRGNVVYLWPEKAQDKKLPPLVLRLITLPGAGGKRMHLLTNVLDETLLSDAQAEAMYRRRWGIELVYRSLKQTMGRRRMRCDAPANAAVELDWAVIGMWMLGLLSVSRILEAGRSPYEWSVAASLRVVRQTMRSAAPRQRRRRQPSLAEALAAATLDGYQRTGSKKSRHWPHKKREKPPGAPRARNASEMEIKLASRLRQKKMVA
jgi:Transposase DDE domain